MGTKDSFATAMYQMCQNYGYANMAVLELNENELILRIALYN